MNISVRKAIALIMCAVIGSTGMPTGYLNYVKAQKVVLYGEADTLESLQEKLEAAKKEIDALQSSYDEAKKESESLSSKLNEKNKLYLEAVQEQKAAEELVAEIREKKQAQVQARDSKKEAVKSAQATISDIQRSLSELSAQKAASEAVISNLNGEIEAIQTELEAVNAKLADKENEVAVAQAAAQACTEKLTEKQQKIQEIEEEVEKAQQLIDKGSYGYFENKNATGAMAILTDTNVSNYVYENKEPEGFIGYTNIGKEGDATSLENMKNSLEWIKECNRIRTENEGLNPCTVSDVAMAMAQTDANYSSNIWGHASYYKVAENIAKGYRNSYDDTGRNPFDGWYTSEKQYYQEHVNEYAGASTMSAYDLSVNYSSFYSKVGHYLNIITAGTPVTGYAVNSSARVHAQEFDSYNRTGTGVSIDVYEADFLEYYNTVTGALTEAKAAKPEAEAEFETAKAESEAANKTLAQANDELQEAEGLVTEKESELADKQEELATANTNLKTVNDNITAKQSEEVYAQTSLETVQAELKTLEADLADLIGAEAAYENAQKQLEACKKDVGDINISIEDNKNLQSSLIASLESAKQKLSDIETALKKSIEEEKQHGSEVGTTPKQPTPAEVGVTIVDTGNSGGSQTAIYTVSDKSTGVGDVGEVTYTGEEIESASESITIPNIITGSDGVTYEVTGIADNALKGNTTVKEVTVGNNIVEIGEGAFQNATKLTTVKLGDNVTAIDKNAFAGCAKLKKVTASGSKITTVAESAFKGDKALTSIDLSKSKVKTIGKNAFNGDKKLKTIKINGNSLAKVGKNAFKGVKKNATITVNAKDKKTYNKVVKLIKKSGAKNVKYKFKKKK